MVNSATHARTQYLHARFYIYHATRYTKSISLLYLRDIMILILAELNVHYSRAAVYNSLLLRALFSKQEHGDQKCVSHIFNSNRPVLGTNFTIQDCSHTDSLFTLYYVSSHHYLLALLLVVLANNT